MAITRFRNSSILNRGPKYNDFLAGLPFRPIIGTATDGGTGTTVSVAFTGNNPAGAGITYTALSSPGNFTATGPASPITVSGLTAGTAYTFQVKAGNSLGDSAYSAASNSVTPITPTAFESIATVSSSGSSSLLTFNNIPSTYQHLQIRGLGKMVGGGATLFMQLNDQSNYTLHRLRGNGSSVSVNADTSRTYIQFEPLSTAGHSTNAFTAFIIDIHDYASTSKNKTVRCFSGLDLNGTTDSQVQLQSALAVGLGTSAISKITFRTEDLGNWSSGTTFALYGIKA